MSILVTGGAGYIGAHVVQMLDQSQSCVVVDDLSTGRTARVGGHHIVRLDLAADDSRVRLTEVMEAHGIDRVVHLGARKQVGESVERPGHYFQQNVGGFSNLLGAMHDANVGRLVLSSSAATYGHAVPNERGLMHETALCRPASPYGETKLITEWMASHAEQSWGLRWDALRYFNVAGARSPELGDPAVLNLVPMVIERLKTGTEPMIFGTDYETPDGTCLRDYVHVQDLAEAHMLAMDWLLTDAYATNPHRVFNVGTGMGTSVREVVDRLLDVSGAAVGVKEVERRPGDPAVLVADVDLIRGELGWRSRFTIDDIITSAWEAAQ